LIPTGRFVTRRKKMQTRSEETRGRIKQAALKLFAEKGYDPTGVAEICLASEVSKGAFYHHFPSKQSIFLELLKKWLEDLDSELGRVMDTSRSVPEGLLAMASQMQGVFSAADGRVHLFLEFWQQARRDPEIWKEFIAPYRRYQDFFARIIQKGVEEGSFRSVDPAVAGQALVALAVGILVQGVLDPHGADWDRMTRDSVRLFISGMSSGGR
jgi:AcrR family transcriptional regulator